MFYDPNILTYEDIIEIFILYLNPVDDHIACYGMIFTSDSQETSYAEAIVNTYTGDFSVRPFTTFRPASNHDQNRLEANPTKKLER